MDGASLRCYLSGFGAGGSAQRKWILCWSRATIGRVLRQSKPSLSV